RWCRPNCGLHVVFLGPDGVGKSTVIEHVQKDIHPAFLRNGYGTFAPSILPEKLQEQKSTPHQLPPRGLVASLVKASWWAVAYTLGYFVTIYPTLCRCGIFINHRYLLDAIVDHKRYRYGGPDWVLRFIRA